METNVNLSQILQCAQAGDREARADLIQAAYNELRSLAAGKMRDERADHTLTATALVNEMAVRLMDESQVPVQNRKQFFAYASTAMRRLLVDHARGKKREKRGGDRIRFSFEEAMVACEEQSDELLALNDALNALAELKPRKARVVEMRYFGGMSNQEVADTLEISVATVKRDWDVARGWLIRELMSKAIGR